jgi:hypothetical protein
MGAKLIEVYTFVKPGMTFELKLNSSSARVFDAVVWLWLAIQEGHISVDPDTQRKLNNFSFVEDRSMLPAICSSMTITTNASFSKADFAFHLVGVIHQIVLLS